MIQTIRFFEKPGCTGNARQKAILAAAGHILKTENILTYQFTRSELRSYFDELPVNLWFNLSAPKIKSGEINTEIMSEEQALTAMLADPLLIRRPLIEVNGKKSAGFNVDKMEAAGVSCSSNKRLNLLRGQDLEGCPGNDMGIKCDEPRALPKLD
jgi:nitrogenase-associated protein